MSLAQPYEISERMDRVVKNFYLSGCGYKEAMREFRRAFLRSMLASKRNNQCAVAEQLGVHRNTIGYMVADLGLRRERKSKPKGAAMPPPQTTHALDEDAHLRFRAEVRAAYPDAMLHTETTREKTNLYICVSHQRSDLAQLSDGHITQWLSCWCFSPAEAWQDAARRLSEQEHA